MRNMRYEPGGAEMKFCSYGHCSDHVGETIREAAVTKPKPPPDQLEDLLRWLLADVAAPVPVPALVQEVPTVEKLLQCLVAEIPSRQPAAVMESKPPLDQLEDLRRQLLANRTAPVPVPAPVHEVPTGKSCNSVWWLRYRVASRGRYETETSCGSVGGSAQTVTSEQDCPGSGPSSGSGGADGRMVAATSDDGVTESPAGGCEFDRARGVEIVSLRTSDIETTALAEINQKRSECRRMFFMRKVGSFCSPLPRSGCFVSRMESGTDIG